MKTLTFTTHVFPVWKTGLLVIALILGSLSPAAAQEESEDPCTSTLANLQKSIQNNWNNLDGLTEILNGWQSNIRGAFEYYDPARLRNMTPQELENVREALAGLRDCAPKLKNLLNLLKSRIGELEKMQGLQTTSKDPHHRERQEKLKEVEELHGEVVDILEDILK